MFVTIFRGTFSSLFSSFFFNLLLSLLPTLLLYYYCIHTIITTSSSFSARRAPPLLPPPGRNTMSVAAWRRRRGTPIRSFSRWWRARPPSPHGMLIAGCCGIETKQIARRSRLSYSLGAGVHMVLVMVANRKPKRGWDVHDPHMTTNRVSSCIAQ